MVPTVVHYCLPIGQFVKLNHASSVQFSLLCRSVHAFRYVLVIWGSALSSPSGI